VVPMRWRK